jgi:hypothetical protein
MLYVANIGFLPYRRGGTGIRLLSHSAAVWKKLDGAGEVLDTGTSLVPVNYRPGPLVLLESSQHDQFPSNIPKLPSP